MSKNSFTGYIKSRWLSVLILLANSNQNAYSLTTSRCNFSTQKSERTHWTTSSHSFQFTTTSVFWRKSGKTEEHSISSNFCSCTKPANLIASKLPWTHKLWPVHINKPVMYFGISSDTLWCPPCHPPLPLPLSPLFCPFEKLWSFL